MNRRTQPVIMWGIVNGGGYLFGGIYHTRREAIQRHVDLSGWTWRTSRKYGCRAVKVRVTVIEQGGMG